MPPNNHKITCQTILVELVLWGELKRLVVQGAKLAGKDQRKMDQTYWRGHGNFVEKNVAKNIKNLKVFGILLCLNK